MNRAMGDQPARGPGLAAGIGHARQSVFAALQGRIDAYRAQGGELIPLHIGDTYLPPPDGAMSGIEDHRELSVYGPIGGLPELAEALAKRLGELHLEVVESARNVLIGCGCTHALYCGARAVLDPGDEVLMLSPYWPLIPGVLETCGAVPIELPLSSRLYQEPDLDIGTLLERTVTDKTRALYVTTPNNPDGQVYTVAQLQTMAHVAQQHDLWVLADEVYADFVYDGAHASIANLPDMAERTITSHSMSKSHGLAGTRIGYVAATEHVIAAARRVSNHTVYNVPLAMQNVALRALLSGEAWLQDARQRYRQARDATSSALTRAGVAHTAPRGGCFFFLDLGAYLEDRSPTELMELTIDAGVLLAPGRAFGEAYDAYARLCFTGAPLAVVLEGVERFVSVL